LRSRLAILLVVTLAVCVVAFGVARAQGTLSGTVVRLADGSPVAGAVVTVAGPHQPPISQRTGADGSFSFSVGGGPYSLGAGPYSVGVSATGFKSQVVVGVAGGNVGSIALVRRRTSRWRRMQVPRRRSWPMVGRASSTR
jgi:hypothetical protein